MWMWNVVVFSMLGCNSGGQKFDSYPGLESNHLFIPVCELGK
jgi:hypothetical protein